MEEAERQRKKKEYNKMTKNVFECDRFEDDEEEEEEV
jgi:hypothetical protein